MSETINIIMYITFAPYYSGLSNVIMSYEVAFGLSHITGRTLVLPKDAFLLFYTDQSQQKKDFKDIWTLFDKDIAKEEFNLIEFDQVAELNDVKHLIENHRSYTAKITDHVKDIYNFKLANDKNSTCETHDVFVNDSSRFIDSADYKNFINDRSVVDLNLSNKFIHFENNLFGHFWYHIYPGGPEKRNILKNKINKVFKYKNKFYEIAKKVKDQIGTYNAIHIRRNDFLKVREKDLQSIDSDEKVLYKLEHVVNNDIPLYIATDESNKDFFKKIKEKYQVYFFKDFNFDLSPLEEAVVEQIICAESEFFIGTYLSTYSKRINVMRGLEGKQANDYMGINYLLRENVEIDSGIPWNTSKRSRWHWEYSSYVQWYKE